MAAIEHEIPVAEPALKYQSSRQGFAFMSLPADIRYMIYKAFFVQHIIIIRDHLPPAFMCGRRYRKHHVENPKYTEDNDIALLQVCKKIYAEARTLFPRVPSHLVLSRELHKLPSSLYIRTFDMESSIPLKHITCLTLNAKNFGHTKLKPRICPGPPETRQLFQMLIDDISIGARSGWAPEGPPEEPKRFPNLENVSVLSDLLFKCLSHLREMHVYDVLKLGQSWDQPPCTCPIAGTQSCTCGRCVCKCITHPPVPYEVGPSLAETKSQLYETFKSRMQAALPEGINRTRKTRSYSDLDVMIGALARGVHIFLHDEIALIAVANPKHNIFRGLWRGTYHLIPPEEASTPSAPPTGHVPSPREIKKREREVAKSQGFRKRKKSMKRHRGMIAQNISVHHESLLELGREKDICSEDFPVKPLREFDAVMEVDIVDSSMFDVVIDRGTVESDLTGEKGTSEKLWKWS